MHLGIIKTELQSWGVRTAFPTAGRKGGAGPAEGGTLLLDGCCAMVPITSDYVRQSPYCIEHGDASYVLLKKGKKVSAVAFPPAPKFYGLKTADGLDYKKIALLHGTNCLGSTVYQDCIYWDSPSQCKFCGIRLSLDAGLTVKEKTAEQLAEVAEAAEAADGISHVTLTTGTVNGTDKGIQMLARCSATIKQRTGLPVHVQFEPPSDLALLDILVENGVDTVGVHIESFDPVILAVIAPAKKSIGQKRFMETWQQAVRLFGRNQVSSFIIAGLGEDPSSIIAGSELLAEMGVYPFVVPLRPIPGSSLGLSRPPAPEGLIDLYRAVARSLKKHRLSARSSNAGCVRCGACSALPEFEDEG